MIVLCCSAATTQGGVADCAYWKDNSVCHDLDVS
jgi:hypothetical protein